MSEILDSLKIDKDDIEWQDLAACSGINTNLFFDDYENDQMLAKSIDEMCMICPVAKDCLLAGVEGNEYGVWGGAYLSLGKIDKVRNSHKTQDFWKRWKAKHGWK